MGKSSIFIPNGQELKTFWIRKEIWKLIGWLIVGTLLFFIMWSAFSNQITYRQIELWNRPDLYVRQDSQLTKQNVVNYSEIMMRKDEVDRILNLLRDVDTYIEWGSGGSTLNYPTFVKKASYSIEHNPSWCRHIRQRLMIRPQLSNVKYFCVGASPANNAWNPLN